MFLFKPYYTYIVEIAEKRESNAYVNCVICCSLQNSCMIFLRLVLTSIAFGYFIPIESYSAFLLIFIYNVCLVFWYTIASSGHHTA